MEQFTEITQGAQNVATTAQNEEVRSSETEQTMGENESPPVNIHCVAPTTMNVAISETTTVTNESGEGTLNHSILNNRDASNQHPIGAITGLQVELDNLKALDTNYSDKYNSAYYYLWYDENPEQEDRDGYFVTMVSGTLRVKKCTATDNIVGVTVSEAAFVGGQGMPTRGYQYGLVTHAGVVNVHCASDIIAGDYVISNANGVATKTANGCGYCVLSVQTIDTLTYATISLTPQAVKIYDLKNEVLEIDARVDTVETNLVAAVDTANRAYALADDVEEALTLARQANITANDAATLAENTSTEMADVTDVANNAASTAIDALAIANVAAQEAENARQQAITAANNATAQVHQLITDLEPVSTWSDPESGNQGAEYLVHYLENDVATVADVSTLETRTNNVLTATQRNATSIQSLVAKIAKYSVGEYSQAYGLSLDDAIETLSIGTVYVPTILHSEMYMRDELLSYDANGEADTIIQIDGGSLSDIHHRAHMDAIPRAASDLEDYTQEFIPEYYYVWDGVQWILPHSSPTVWLTNTYVVGDGIRIYWYTCNQDVIHDGITYEAETLYLWQDNHWVAIANTAQNASSRVTNLVRQTAESYSIEIINARGGSVSLDMRINNDEASIQELVGWKENTTTSLANVAQKASDNEASIQGLTTWKDDAEESLATVTQKANSNETSIQGLTTWKTGVTTSLATVTQKASDNEAYISQIANVTNEDGSINAAASILMAVNADEASTIKLSADKINLDGLITAINSQGNTTTIDGNKITTGTLTASQIDATNLHVNAANIDGTITANNINATSGTVGGWNILEDYLSSVNGKLYLFSNGDGTATINGQTLNNLVMRSNERGTSTFGLTTNGKIYASDVNLSGVFNATGGNIGGWNIGRSEWLNGLTTPYLRYNNGVNYAAMLGADGMNIHVGNSHIQLGTNLSSGEVDDAYSSDSAFFEVYISGSPTNPRFRVDVDGIAMDGLITVHDCNLGSWMDDVISRIENLENVLGV